MSVSLVCGLAGLAQARAARLRQAIARAMVAQGIEAVAVDGEQVRLSARGLMRRWMKDLALREAGRDGR